MPDFGELRQRGKGLLKGAKDSADAVQDKVRDRAKDGADVVQDRLRRFRSDAAPDAAPDAAEATGATEATESIEAPAPPEPAPPTGPIHQLPQPPGYPPHGQYPARPGPPQQYGPPPHPGQYLPPHAMPQPPQPYQQYPGQPYGGPPPLVPMPQGHPAQVQPLQPLQQEAPVQQQPPKAEGPGLADEPEEHATDADVRELVELLTSALANRRPPPGPIVAPWSFGIGVVLAEHPRVPKRLHWAVRKLDRFGGIAVNPEQIALDGDEVDWDDVTEVQTRHVVDYLLGDAVQQQLETLPVPWFPGRKRLLDALGQALLTLVIATAKDQLERFDFDLRIPAEIEYKGMLRSRKTISAGVLSAVVLADPAVNRSITETARVRGIPVRAVGEEQLADAAARAAELRQKVAALEAELDRFTRRFGRKP